MKLFVSMSMNGKPDNELRSRLNEYVESIKSDENLKDSIKSPIEVINTIEHENTPRNPSRLWYLGESIKKLNDADMVYFADDWYKANGCWVEFVAANLYLDRDKIAFDYPDEYIARWILDIMINISHLIQSSREKKEAPNTNVQETQN